MTITVDDLAQEIRRVDGEHKLGAGALAEALMPFLALRQSSPPDGQTADGWQDISTADRSIAVVMDFGGVTLRHSYPIWARTDGGEPREVSWAARGAENPDDGYWWDWDADDVCEPDQWFPHPFARVVPTTKAPGEEH